MKDEIYLDPKKYNWSQTLRKMAKALNVKIKIKHYSYGVAYIVKDKNNKELIQIWDDNDLYYFLKGLDKDLKL